MAKTETAVISVDQAVASYDKGDLELIKKTVAKGATDQELALFLWTAKARGLNPLTRQIHFVKRGDTGTIQTGIDGFRLIAERTKKYAPSPKPTVFAYTVKDGKRYLDRATVFGVKIVEGHAFEYSATARFVEYAQYFNGVLGNMWKKMPETMLEKCAEAKLLRKGFPEELSGLYTDEEMMQADNTGDLVIHPSELGTAVEGTGEPKLQEIEPDELPFDTDEVEDAEWEDVVEEDAGVDPDNPYMKMLEKCTEHDEPWGVNKYGKHFHKQGNGWCNFGTHQPMKDTLQAVMTTIGLFDDGNKWLNAYCKSKFGEGKTWSKIMDEEKISVVNDFAKMADNPVLLEAAKLAMGYTEEA